jgi:hypothetical protein
MITGFLGMDYSPLLNPDYDLRKAKPEGKNLLS